MDNMMSKFLEIPEDKKKALLQRLLLIKQNRNIPLSSVQQRLWTVYQMNPKDVTNNILLLNKIDGTIKVDMLKESLSHVIRRHESLRTRIAETENKVCQIIEEQIELPFEMKNFMDFDDPEEAAKKYIIHEVNIPFVLENGPLIRFILCRLNDRSFYFVTIVHHIIFDGWSTDVFANEVFQYYRHFAYGDPLRVPELKRQYKDYTLEQYTDAYQNRIAGQLDYWVKKLEGTPYILRLPYDHEKRAERSYCGKQVVGTVNSKFQNDIKRFCDEKNATMFMLTYAVFAVVLNQYTSQNIITAGVPMAGRVSEDLETMIGFFVNMIVLKVDFGDSDLSFQEILQQVSENLVDAYQNQEVSYHKIVEKVCRNTSAADFPFSQVMFNFQNLPACELDNGDFCVEQIRIDTGITKADLTVEFVKRVDSYQVIFEYNADLFEETTILRMMKHYMYLLDYVIQNSDCKMSELPLMQENEAEQVKAVLCGKTTKIREEGIVPLFKEAVRKSGDSIAVQCGEERLTYRELDEKSDRVFRFLRQQGIVKGDFLGVFLDRSIGFYIGMLGLLKAGAVYVPINPNYPEQKMRYIMDDSGIKAVLTESGSRKPLSGDAIRCFCLNDIMTQNFGQEEDVYEKMMPEDTFFLMYTSGSSGNPKGVLVSYKNALNRFQWMWDRYSFSQQDVMAFKTSINFVDSIWEIFGGLLSGIKTVIIKEDTLNNLKLFTEELYSGKVTRLVVVPSLLQEMLNLNGECIEKLRGICLWTSSGEALPVPLKKKFYEKLPESRLLNLYGSTEVMADVTCYETDRNLSDEEFIPIGKLIYNVKARIVDRFGRQVPAGVHGRLLIEGAAVTNGYYQNDELNKSKFLCDGKVFDTGDEVSVGTDGNLRYYSRVDQIVKVRGVRMNLSEIDQVVQQHFLVRQAFSILDDRRDKRIILFITVVNEHLNREMLFQYLKKVLPSYMLPEEIIIIDKFPELPNGKIDRNALYDYLTEKSDRKTEEEEKNELQKNMEDLWKHILEVEGAGLQESFFRIGGNSLKAMSLISDILVKFGVNISLKEFYENDTIKKVCEIIEQTQDDRRMQAEIEACESNPETLWPLSSAQERIYLVTKMQGESLNYNLPLFYEVHGQIDMDRLESAFQLVLSRNEILRTAFIYSDKNIYQKIYEDSRNHVIRMKAERSEIDRIIKEFIRPFDLSQPNLIRLACVYIDENTSYILLDMHHIISDGRSLDLFFSQLIYAYKNNDLPFGRIQYKDYIQWRYSNRKGSQFQKQEQYWLQKLSGIERVTTVPVDYQISNLIEKSGAMYYCEMPHDISDRLKKFEIQSGFSEFMIILAGLGSVLYKYGNFEDIVVEAPIDTRQRSEIRDLIGNFINVLAMKIEIDQNQTVYEYLLKVYETVVEDIENKDYPYEELKEKLQLRSRLEGNALSSIMLAVHNNKMKVEGVSELEFAEYFFRQYASAKYDITVNVMDQEDATKIYVEYCTQLYCEETVKQFVDHLINVIDFMIRYPLSQVKEIQMLSDEEYRKIVYEYNDTGRVYRDKEIYPEIFENAVQAYKDRIAVYDQNTEKSYADLAAGAEMIAGNLQSKGIGRGSIVVICVDRTYRLFELILGILKAGASYVPLDPAYPKERIKFIAEDSGADLIVLENDGVLEDIDPERTVRLETLYDECSVDGFTERNCSADPAYIIYTSGSTGKPKGVVISHRALNNFIVGMKEAIGFFPGEKVLCCTSVSFDIFVLESLVSLSCGCSVVLANNAQQMQAKELCDLIYNHRINKLQMVPVRLQVILNEAARRKEDVFASVDTVMIGGEAYSINLVKALRERFSGNIYNMYGPTETTVWSSVKKIEEEDEEIVLGRPIANTMFYLLDEYFNVVPYGVPGNLYIGGDGLANGYLHREDLTQERFIDNPFIKGQKMYDTGDLAKWTRRGEVLYLGRRDFQVKIGGYRIECSEIEGVMEAFPGIEQAVVIKSGEYSEAVLCGFYTVQQEVSEEELRKYLLEKLPAYMVPTVLVKLDEFPMTPNKKIARNMLKVPEKAKDDRQYVEASNEIEKSIAQVWRGILGKEDLSMDDNFFQVGGNSLLLIEMHSQLARIYPDAISVAELFAYPSIRKIAEHIGKKVGEKISLPSVNLEETFFEDIVPDGMEYLSFELDSGTVGKIKELCERVEINEEESYYAMIVFSLASMTADEKAGICVPDEGSLIRLVEYNFKLSQDNDIKEYIANFAKQYRQRKDGITIAQFEECLNHEMYQKNCAYVICGMGGNQKNIPVSDAYTGLMISVSRYRDFYRVTCEYDTSRLNKIAARKLFSQINSNLVSLSELAESEE